MTETVLVATTGLRRAAKRSVATLVFAVTGSLLGQQIFDMDIASWKLAAGAGIGALINLAYRWAEDELRSGEAVDAVPERAVTEPVG